MTNEQQTDLGTAVTALTRAIRELDRAADCFRRVPGWSATSTEAAVAADDVGQTLRHVIDRATAALTETTPE